MNECINNVMKMRLLVLNEPGTKCNEADVTGNCEVSRRQVVQ